MAAPLADLHPSLELAIFHWVNRDGGGLLDEAARVLSSKAFGVAAGLAVAVLLWRSLGRPALRSIVALGVAVAISDAVASQLLRPWLGRRRPCFDLPSFEVRWLLPASDVASLPSLHAANFFAMATVASLADRRLAAPAYAVALAVCWSRVYGGVHWPLDVAAGAVWGTLAALAAWEAAARAFRPRGERA